MNHPADRSAESGGASVQLKAGPIEYSDVGTGPTVVFLHGVLMSGTVWDPVVARLRGEVRCVVPTLPLGAHSLPVRRDADLSLAGFGRMVHDLVDELDLRDVTLVGNDHAAILAAAVLPSPRVSRLVVTSCEAFENYPPGLPGKNLRLIASVPGGLLFAAHLLRIRAMRRLPITFGWLSKRPLPDNLIDTWLQALRGSVEIRRDLRRYASGARRRQMAHICDRLADVPTPTLVVWPPEDRVQRPDHGARLARLLPNSRLELVDDSYTLVMRDQPDRVAELVRSFIFAGDDS